MPHDALTLFGKTFNAPRRRYLHKPPLWTPVSRARGARCARMTQTVGVNGSPIRVVIAEDQALVRRGTVLLLSMAADMECVGQASNGDEAVGLALLLRPDVVLMDLHMPVKGGVAATREITLAQPSTQVLVLTTLDDDEAVFEAVRAGAQAYLLKDASEAELLETIRALRRGESRLTPRIARKVMDQFRRLAPVTGSLRSSSDNPAAVHPNSKPSNHASGSRTEDLSDKEERVLSLIAEGASNRHIAQAMSLAEGTIKNYVSRVMEKLHANTRTELAVHASRQRRDV
jgi:DNA-binding NarL/FixJ family response regulator